MEYYHLHPIAVHFPLALLLAGFVAEIVSLFLKGEKWSWLVPAAQWTLWFGTICVWGAVGLGLLAEETAPHIPSAWEVLADHETLGFWTAGLFSTLSLWRFFFRNQWMLNNKMWRVLFVLAWLISAAVLIATGFHGGQLVFDFGMGVKSS